ncbi:MAG TPA: MATE family efflux transporter, partial [Porphyromonadaceae bacterium]|nr:MATE family efflux transporter [Porphyromonadaceae bacterium]
MDRKIFRLAIPNIISNITVPLIGLANIGIAGHLDSAKYIGAMSLGVTIFNMIYWNFSFLRMSTSGFTSQALGARNLTEATSVLLRSVIVSVSLGVLIILLQYPIGQFAFRFILSGEEIKGYVEAYFRICVWGSPAVLTMYAFNGWFIGMQNAKTPMFIAIFNNILNIGLNFTFVFGLGMNIEGIA